MAQSSSTAGAQGRSSAAVPSFVSTFVVSSGTVPTLCSSVQSIPTMSFAPRVSASGTVGNAPILEQAFVVGPGFSPIPYKLVSQITSGKYVDLSELLSVNLLRAEQEPKLILDGRLIITSTAKKPKQRIEDIVSWTEAFTIYSLVLTSYFPDRWRDLLAYKLLILRTYRQFSGRVWLSYDQAFREFAAASNLTNWSEMNVQLYSFHAAGAPARNQSAKGSPSDGSEAVGSNSGDIVCKSWNRGKCSSPYANCKYVHKCSGCAGNHRVSECSGASKSSPKRRSRSPSIAREGISSRKRK